LLPNAGFFNGHQHDLYNDAFPGAALGLLGEARTARVSSLILKGLGVASAEQVFLHNGPLFFCLITVIARSLDMRYWQIFPLFSQPTARRSGNIAQR
jgi:hypothetical protein